VSLLQQPPRGRALDYRPQLALPERHNRKLPFGFRLYQKLVEVGYFVCARNFPGRIGVRLRVAFLRLGLADVGKGVTIGPGVRIRRPGLLTVGDGATVARDTYLDARGGLELGAGALIGFESILLSETHNSDEFGVPVQQQGMFRMRTAVGRNTWLGTRVVVLPGVTVGDDTFVGAAAVVHRDLEPGVVAGGIPVRVIRQRER
jgi:acetyltransferase-like isoleucine patch superfamily enzyme